MEGELKRLSQVLVAVAIDERDRQVFAHALALARRHDAKLLLLHATSPEVSLNRGATQRVDFLRRLRALADAAGVEIRVAVQTGPIHEIILLHARARNVDLIVMGTAKNERRRGFSGWVAERVLRDAPCPTLIVPPTSAIHESLSEAILCAVDFSPASHAAIQEAVRLSDRGNRPVTLLHVVDGLGLGEHSIRGWLATHECHRGVGTDALKKLRFLIPLPDRGAVMARVAVGDPVREIIETARSLKAQLLVIGATSRTRVGSKLFGKTAQLLRDAECPVLAVPLRTAARAEDEDTLRAAA
jgi:nucleotide-binding universal stress UspA family protein